MLGQPYNWYRHYDATTGRYTQTDPLGLNQGPQAPAPSAILLSDAAPGRSLAVNDNLIDLSSIGADSTGKSGLLTGLGYLMASQQGTYGLESHTGLADSAGASDPGSRVTRDGISLYAYVKQSPVMWKDKNGLFSKSLPVTEPANGFLCKPDQVRIYDSCGDAFCDIDFHFDHGTGVPHLHFWIGGVRQGPVSLSPRYK